MERNCIILKDLSIFCGVINLVKYIQMYCILQIRVFTGQLFQHFSQNYVFGTSFSKKHFSVKINVFVTNPVTSENVNSENYSKHFFKNHGIYKYLYFIKTVTGSSFLTKPFHFHNNTQTCIFVHITNSSFCHVFVINTAFVTFQGFENNPEYKPKHNFSIIKYHNFW